MTNLLILSMMATTASLGPSDDGGTRVAVVSIPVVSEQYKKTSDLEAQFDQVRRRLSERRDELKGKVDLLTRSLKEELKPGTDEYRARQKDLAMAQAELQWFMDSERQRVEQGLADSLREIFSDIQDAVRAIAEQRGIDIVLASDELPKDAPNSSGQVRQQILLQKVVYWSPRVDITKEVVERLNQVYASKPLGTTGGSAARKPNQ